MPAKPRKTVSPSGRKAGTDDAARAEAVKPPKAFFDGVKELIKLARATVSRGIDFVQVHTNFEIGRRIVQEEQRGQSRAAYGEKVIQLLSERLQAEYGRGYSKGSLACMRSFYVIYKNRDPIFQTVSGKSGSASIGQQSADQLSILQPVVRESRPFCLGWSQYAFLLSIKNPKERIFYEIEAASPELIVDLDEPLKRAFYEIECLRGNWGVRELKRQKSLLGRSTARGAA